MTLDPARYPSPILPSPRVILEREPYPRATFAIPVILAVRAFHPNPILESIFPPHRPILRLFTSISPKISSFAPGVIVPIPTFVPLSYICDGINPFHPIPNFVTQSCTHPVIPLALSVPEKLAAHRAFPLESDTRMLPDAAPVGRRNPRKFPIPATSSVYPGVCVPIPMAAQLLQRKLLRIQVVVLPSYRTVSPSVCPVRKNDEAVGKTQLGTPVEVNPHTT